jgi:hypothetical protein
MNTFVKGSRFTITESGTDMEVYFGADLFLTIDTDNENALTISKPITGVELKSNYTVLTIQLSSTEDSTLTIDRNGNVEVA